MIPLDGQVVLFNMDYRFLGAIALKRAMKLITLRKVEVVKYEESVVYDPSRTGNKHVRTVYKMPKILRLLRLVRQFIGKVTQRTQRKLLFNKKYVFLRDNKECGYCLGPGDTLDHIIPQSRGGKTTYQNTVTCCTSCNNRKKNRTPQEAGMSLHKRPYVPTIKQITEWRQRELAAKFTFDYSTLFV